MVKCKCTVCGYIYDPELGDPDGDIAPGTPFEELSDDWVCPVCGASKDEFEKVEERRRTNDRKLEQGTVSRDTRSNTYRNLLR